MTSRSWWLAFTLACAARSAGPSAEATLPDAGPEAAVNLVSTLYTPILAGDWGDPLGAPGVRSAALDARFRASKDHPGYDPVVDGQDARITGLETTLVSYTPPRATVAARFHNFDRPTEVTFSLVLERGGWRVDNVRGSSGSDLLQALGARR